MSPIYRAKISGGLQRKPPEKAQRKAHDDVGNSVLFSVSTILTTLYGQGFHAPQKSLYHL